MWLEGRNSEGKNKGISCKASPIKDNEEKTGRLRGRKEREDLRRLVTMESNRDRHLELGRQGYMAKR
ncbi:hypothetical protein NQZ68_018414, partial [Dissostichus eleginoides]